MIRWACQEPSSRNPRARHQGDNPASRRSCHRVLEAAKAPSTSHTTTLCWRTLPIFGPVCVKRRSRRTTDVGQSFDRPWSYHCPIDEAVPFPYGPSSRRLNDPLLQETAATTARLSYRELGPSCQHHAAQMTLSPGWEVSPCL